MVRVTLIIMMMLCGAIHAEPRFIAYDRFHETPDVQGGRLLIKDLACAACHHSNVDYLQASPGPILNGSRHRIKKSWIRQHLMDPAGTRMPDVLASADNKQGQVDALVEYVLSLSSKKVEFKAPRNSDFNRGKKLFHSIGCFACHSKGDDQTGRALKDLQKKYTHMSLAEFLQNPHARRPAGKMPRFNLTHSQAADIAAYLIDEKDIFTVTTRLNQSPNSSLVAKGKASFATFGCASCHSVEGVASTLKARPLSELSSADCSQADYHLSSSMMASITAALKAGAKSINDKQRLTLMLKEKNCYACHSRDGFGGPMDDKVDFFHGNESLADVGRFPPGLDGVGSKLTDAAFDKVLSGKADVRPYLDVKMPDFGSSVHAIKPLLQKLDAVESRSLPAGDAEIGRTLVGNAATGCINCHHVGKARSAGIEGPDISSIHTKLTQDWFTRNLINPAACRPGTLMPSFWPEGKSSLPHILSGDTDEQIASIWAYLKNPQDPPPGALKNSGQFQLRAADQPVYHRSFRNKSTPMLYIAYPNGLNVGVNTYVGRVSMIWKGDFVDAYKTWYLRRDPQADILSSQTTPVPPLVWLTEITPAPLTFEGYRRLPNGTELLYSNQDCTVKELLTVSEGRLSRNIHISIEGDSSLLLKLKGGFQPLKNGVYKETLR